MRQDWDAAARQYGTEVERLKSALLQRVEAGVSHEAALDDMGCGMAATAGRVCGRYGLDLGTLLALHETRVRIQA